MAIINRNNLDAASREFISELTAVLNGAADGTFAAYTKRVSASGAKSVDHIGAAMISNFRKWTGEREITSIRAYVQNIQLTKYEHTIGIPVEDINAMDPSVSQTLSAMAASSASHDNEIVVDLLLTNPTCYDGVSLLSNSHPNVGTGGTSDNLTVNGLSFAEYKTAVSSLRSMADERGKKLGCSPEYLIVGDENEELAKQIVGDIKPVGYANTGEPATSSVIDVELSPNYIAGGVVALVEPEIDNSEWFLKGKVKGDAQPMYLYNFLDWQNVVVDDPSNTHVFMNDEVLFGLHAHKTAAAGAWQLIYGSVTA